MGACESLADFNVCLDNWLARNSIDRSKCNIRRVDFCMNCYDEEAAERFIGFCDLLIYAFIIRYDVPQKE